MARYNSRNMPGPGDSVTWPPYSGHPGDPRAPDDDDDFDDFDDEGDFDED